MLHLEAIEICLGLSNCAPLENFIASTFARRKIFKKPVGKVQHFRSFLSKKKQSDTKKESEITTFIQPVPILKLAVVLDKVFSSSSSPVSSQTTDRSLSPLEHVSAVEIAGGQLFVFFKRRDFENAQRQLLTFQINSSYTTAPGTLKTFTEWAEPQDFGSKVPQVELFHRKLFPVHVSETLCVATLHTPHSDGRVPRGEQNLALGQQFIDSFQLKLTEISDSRSYYWEFARRAKFEGIGRIVACSPLLQAVSNGNFLYLKLSIKPKIVEKGEKALTVDHLILAALTPLTLQGFCVKSVIMACPLPKTMPADSMQKHLGLSIGLINKYFISD